MLEGKKENRITNKSISKLKYEIFDDTNGGSKYAIRRILMM